MQYLHTNNASSNLRNAITSVGQTTITVTSGHGSLFPLPVVDQGFFVTVEDRRSGRLEIMLCTSRSGDTLTVQRGKQGTIPQTFEVGVNVSNRITSQILNEFVAATVNVVPIERIPTIPSSKIENLDAAKLVGPGKVNAALLPAIPPALLTSVPAASLTGTISADRLPTIPAAKLPVIPPALLTSVPAASLTGTIAAARLPAIPPANLTSVPAASLTGTIANARLPAAITITGGLQAANLVITGSPGNASIVGYLNVGGNIAADLITAQLYHPQYGGYVRIGSYSSTYGAGVGRFYYDASAQKFVFIRHDSGSVANVHAGSYLGSGASLTGVVKDSTGVGQGGLFLGPRDGHTGGTIYAGSSLRSVSFMVHYQSNNLTIAYGSSPSGKWRAMNSGSGNADQMCLGFFVRTE